MPAQGCCSPGPNSSLAVPLHPQEATQWCWAASGQMVMEYLGHGVTQCTQANQRLARTDCRCDNCSSGLEPTCDEDGRPEFERNGFDFDWREGEPLSWSELTEQLSIENRSRRTPVAFSWKFTGGGGHMMVAKGYQSQGGEHVRLPRCRRPASYSGRLVVLYDFLTYLAWLRLNAVIGDSGYPTIH